MPAIPSPRSNRRPRLEIIPLIDIMFFLLATFMMVSLAMLKNEGIPLDLPAAQTASTPDASQTDLTLSVSRDGQIFVQQQAVTLDELASHLAHLQRTQPDAHLILQGDDGADFGRIVSVLDEARRHGLPKVVLRTRPRERP